MNAKVIISTDGQLRIIIDRGAGTFADGKAAIERLIAAVKAQGVEFTSIGVTEMHLHEGETVTAVNAISAGHKH